MGEQGAFGIQCLCVLSPAARSRLCPPTYPRAMPPAIHSSSHRLHPTIQIYRATQTSSPECATEAATPSSLMPYGIRKHKGSTRTHYIA